MSDTTLSTEEMKLVELGIQAEHLLNNDTFQDVINALSDQLSSAIINTQLPDTDRRERLYMMHSCLVELIGILKTRVATKDQIEQRVNDVETEV